MVRFLIAFTFLIGSAFAGNVPQAANVVQFGAPSGSAAFGSSSPGSSISSIIGITMSTTNQTATHYYGFYPRGAFGQAAVGSHYNPTAAKSFYVAAAMVKHDTSASNSKYLLGYNSADFTEDTASPGGTQTFFGASAGFSIWVGNGSSAGTQINLQELVGTAIPAGKFIFVKAVNGTGGDQLEIDLQGYEL